MAEDCLDVSRTIAVDVACPRGERISHRCHLAVPVVVRLTLYLAIAAGLMAALPRLALAMGDPPGRFFAESGVLEHAQCIILGITTLVLILGGVCNKSHSPLFWALACLAALAAIRELDSFLDDHVIFGWQGPAVLMLAVLIAVICRCRAALLQQLPRFLYTPAFGILWAGFLLVVVFAQLIGHGELWQAIMAENYHRDFKRAMQESSEYLGYCVILMGTIETVIQTPYDAPCSSPR